MHFHFEGGQGSVTYFNLREGGVTYIYLGGG